MQLIIDDKDKDAKEGLLQCIGKSREIIVGGEIVAIFPTDKNIASLNAIDVPCEVAILDNDDLNTVIVNDYNNYFLV